MSATLNSEDLALIALSLKSSQLFEYKGDVDNVFSIVSGSFVGSINFYSIDMADFLSMSTSPPLTNLICILGSNGLMSSVDNIGVDGEVLLFTLVGFEALENTIINYYNDHLSTNTRFFIPKGLKTVTSSLPYYPTVSGNMLGVVATSNVSPLSDLFINKQIANLEDIDFDRIVQPIVVSQPSILASNIVRMNIYRDRTIDVQFDLHRDITGDEIYFAMKSDRKNEFYDVEPIMCVIDDPVKGYITLTIPEDNTVNLKISKYYGELFRKTASGKFQTLVVLDIDLLPEIISTRDV